VGLIVLGWLLSRGTSERAAAAAAASDAGTRRG